ncbi:hypothetical protein DPSP01_008098 [Paraphaeosphaeria sporulosa]
MLLFQFPLFYVRHDFCEVLLLLSHNPCKLELTADNLHSTAQRARLTFSAGLLRVLAPIFVSLFRPLINAPYLWRRPIASLITSLSPYTPSFEHRDRAKPALTHQS